MSELGFRPTVSEAAMSLPLCCGWCGEPGKPSHKSNIITCARCGKQTSAVVAEEHRTRRYEALDRSGGWSPDGAKFTAESWRDDSGEWRAEFFSEASRIGRGRGQTQTAALRKAMSNYFHVNRAGATDHA